MLTTFEAGLKFPLDGFQREAMAAIEAGKSTVVCAPTGSGKTLIAEFAIAEALEKGLKLFYTTPLKALSNQKFNDFRKAYGDHKVGILTGDTSVQRDAQIVVMTTEVFRNMLYSLHERDDTVLNDVAYVVLDECHYMNDAERGTVWEETIILCPESIQLIALSATVANAQELTDWITSIHHDTVLIQTDFRPVPLRFLYDTREALVPLFESQERKHSKEPPEMNRQLKTHRKGFRFAKEQRPWRVSALVQLMDKREMLPAIFFAFSRKGCQRFLEQVSRLELLTEAEQHAAQVIIDGFLERNPFFKNDEILPYLRRGFGAHHAGLLPGIKVLVETLFQAGLMKVVFATETLAAGINMPARSTVITAVTKPTGDGHRMLNASEFLQMSGRAGRRGMDEVGYVVVVSTQYRSAQEVATLASSGADPLVSQFTPTYGMVLNLMQRHSLDDAKTLVQESFGQYTIARQLEPLRVQLESKQWQLYEAERFDCPANVANDDFTAYLAASTQLSDAYKFVKQLKQQIKRHGPQPEMVAELGTQQTLVASLKAQLAEYPCDGCEVLSQHRKLAERIPKLTYAIKDLQKDMVREQNQYWQLFLNRYKLLRDQGYIDKQIVANEAGESIPTERPTEAGMLASGFKVDNAFYFAEVLKSGVLETLAPHQLAAACCAMVNDSTKDDHFTRLRLSAGTGQALQQMVQVAKHVMRVQKRFDVDTNVILDGTPAPLMEAWVEGLNWDGLLVTTNCAPGDLVRIFRRTQDLLRQLSHSKFVSKTLAATARAAHDAANREPIREVELHEEDLVREEDAVVTEPLADPVDVVI
jgi:superfamily II RNA helicase